MLPFDNVYEYIEANKEKSYHIQFSEETIEEYSLGFSIYSGSLEISYYTDKELKNKFLA